MNIDDNSPMRHADVEALRDLSEEDPSTEVSRHITNFVKPDR